MYPQVLGVFPEMSSEGEDTGGPPLPPSIPEVIEAVRRAESMVLSEAKDDEVDARMTEAAPSSSSSSPQSPDAASGLNRALALEAEAKRDADFVPRAAAPEAVEFVRALRCFRNDAHALAMALPLITPVEPPSADVSTLALGCPHYTRAAMIRAPCCDRFFGCRFCHDEAMESADCLARLSRLALDEDRAANAAMTDGDEDAQAMGAGEGAGTESKASPTSPPPGEAPPLLPRAPSLLRYATSSSAASPAPPTAEERAAKRHGLLPHRIVRRHISEMICLLCVCDRVDVAVDPLYHSRGVDDVSLGHEVGLDDTDGSGWVHGTSVEGRSRRPDRKSVV